MRYRGRTWIVAGSILALIVAACGGEEAATTEAEESAAEREPTEAEDDPGEEAAGDATFDVGEIRETSLTLGSGVGAAHPLFRGAATYFAEIVDELSAGKIEVETFPEGQLGPLTESLAMLRDGVADFTHVISIYHEGEMPLFQAWQLPWGVDEGVAMHALWLTMQDPDSLISTELRDAGCVPLGGVNSTGYEVMSADRPVASTEDLDGMIVRSPGATADAILRAFGASPAETTSAEMYEALQRGTVDATVIYPSSAMPWSLEEVTSYTTVGAELFLLVGFNLCIAPEVWADLNEDERQLLTDAGRAATIEAQRNIVEDDEVALETFQAAGVELIEWSDAERAPVVELGEEIIDGWVEEVEAAGHAASDVIAEIEAAIEQALSVDDPYDLPARAPLP